jgi:ferredoxin--NADP+ reductase
LRFDKNDIHDLFRFFYKESSISGMLNSTLVGRIEVTPELLILQVRPDTGVPNFKPGQYVALGLLGSAARYAAAQPEKEPPAADKLIKRAYSIGSSPSQRDHLEFYIAVVPDGVLTSRLAALQPGDRLFSQPKVTGTFTVEGIGPERNLVLVSTGTGLAPFMSMVRTEELWTPERRVTVVHGVRYASDFAYADELLSLRESGRALEYLPIASRAGSEFSGMKGRIQKLFEDGVLVPTPDRDSVFLCGNPAMIEDLERYLTERGFVLHSKKSAGNLHVEKYW